MLMTPLEFGGQMESDGDDALRPFPTTHWSLVGRAAGDKDDAERREALGVLLQRYLPALRSHLVVRKRIPESRADDLLQGFLLSKVLQSELLCRADRERGRFRTYLLTALNRHTIDVVRQERAAKRAPDQTPILVEDVDPPSADGDAATDAFDRDWARQTMTEAARRMQEHCQRIDRPDIWGIFRARLLTPMLNGADPMPYDRLIEQFAIPSPAEAFNLLNSAKRMFLRTLRGVIAEYERDDEQIDAEMSDLRRILSKPSA
jgi:RNA polymerase sigma-70 factor (ECF subfamily)